MVTGPLTHTHPRNLDSLDLRASSLGSSRPRSLSSGLESGQVVLLAPLEIIKRMFPEKRVSSGGSIRVLTPRHTWVLHTGLPRLLGDILFPPTPQCASAKRKDGNGVHPPAQQGGDPGMRWSCAPRSLCPRDVNEGEPDRRKVLKRPRGEGQKV